MKITVYIGYDSRENFSDKFPDIVNPPYSVAKHSILKNYNNIGKLCMIKDNSINKNN